MDKKENKTAHKRKKFQGATPAVAVKLPRLQRMQWANIVLTFDKVFHGMFSFCHCLFAQAETAFLWSASTAAIGHRLTAFTVL